MSEKAGAQKDLARCCNRSQLLALKRGCCNRYLAVWEGWQSQEKGIKWMENKKEEYEEKIREIQRDSSDPNAYSICEAIREAQQVLVYTTLYALVQICFAGCD